MTYRGHVKNGQIALDEPASLPEGAEVQVEVLRTFDAPREDIEESPEAQALSEMAADSQKRWMKENEA